ncbi:MAG: 1-(5-phosphoribosyl)-5-[(5-phosphoribosylamino)methylideneamino]imidazole-4-carboxamide isomerase [Deltaproteobacteria bacterium]|jgi:phosphoribosylformimino-5-aminoimidazole carboxamide ribotide isomerase|nr:1-(5-phosphoribosyl)-5-[(5-phosphoribosylamino)methylideneamino]imidazole-4-carboxamide isomerase [Deltaproteobacteria bacterium]
MLIIPAVDIKGGRCVRLFQGREDSETVFSDDPSAMALRWEEEGAELLHVIDLDGAFRKGPQNVEAIRKIIDRVRIPVQLGGGIRNIDTIRMYLDIGVSRVILGTEALRSPDLVYEASRLFPGRIIVAIDARDGYVAVEGWTETSVVSSVDLARHFENCGLAAINFTDIHRDGMQTGPNISQTERLARSVSIPIIASGGVSDIDDIKQLLPLRSSGVVGVITGRALYAGTLDLKACLKIINSAAEAGEAADP